MRKVSIIIPLFNTESYIKNCLENCLNQNVPSNEYEIIVIDDGSTDNSANIVKSLQKKHSNIVLIQKENGGVSSARNKGIQVAKGEYILFVDSDDTIKRNSLKAICDHLDKHHNDLAILNSVVLKNGVVKCKKYQFPEKLSRKTLSGVELFQNQYMRGSVWSVLFKTQFIIDNNLLFTTKMANGEDSLFIAMAFLYAKSINHLDIDFYFVTVREGSASRSWNYNRVEKMVGGLDVIDDYINTNDLSNEQLAIVNISAYRIISNMLFNFFNLKSLKGYYTLKNKVVNNPMYPIKSYGAKQFKRKIALLNFSYDLFCLPFILRGFYFKLKWKLS